MVDFEKELEKESIGDGVGTIESVPESSNLVLEKSKKNPLKKLVLFFGSVIIVLVIISIFLSSGVLGPKIISEKQLIVGASLTMEENKSLKIEVGDEEHEIEVQNVGEDWADIVIRSDPMKFRLNVNEVIEVDIDGDGTSDIRVKLFKIQDGKAIIAVKRIDKEACIEEWICGNWESCVGGKRIRECTDKNSCGSEFFIPLHEQKCVGSNPVGVNESSNKVKGMDDVTKIAKVNFTNNYNVTNKTIINETKLNEKEDSLDNYLVNDSTLNDSGGGPTQYGECGDGVCNLGENTSSYLSYCQEDCNPIASDDESADTNYENETDINLKR